MSAPDLSSYIFSKLVAHHLIIVMLILPAQHLAAGLTNGALFGQPALLAF